MITDYFFKDIEEKKVFMEAKQSEEYPMLAELKMGWFYEGSKVPNIKVILLDATRLAALMKEMRMVLYKITGDDNE